MYKQIAYKGQIIKFNGGNNKVIQIGGEATNADYEILLSGTANDNYYIGETRKTDSLTYNPSTKKLKIDGADIAMASDVNGKVSKSGDTMSGALYNTSNFYAKRTGFTINTSSNNGVSSNQQGDLGVCGNDNGMAGRIAVVAGTDGSVTNHLQARNMKTDGTVIWNELKLVIKKDGTRSIGISEPGIWRTAIECPAMISDSYPTLLPTGGSNGWIKIGTSNTTYGILPSTSGNVGSGHNYIGTSTWYWKYAYVDEIYAAKIMLQSNTDASGTANNKPALIVGGTDSQAHIEIDSNEIIAKSNGTTSTTLYLQDGHGILSLQGSDYSVANQAKFRTAIGMGNATINKGFTAWGTSTSVTCVGLHCIVITDKMFGILWLSGTNQISIHYVNTDGKSYNAEGTGSVTWSNGKYKATRSNTTISVTSTSNSTITLLGL